jgi:Chaperone of endosialidase
VQCLKICIITVDLDNKPTHMKSYILFLILFCLAVSVRSQNVGIGTTVPDTRLQVNGDFSVVAAYKSAIAAPTPAQTVTLVNALTTDIPSADSVCRIYDPGGAGGNYIANITASARVNGSSGSYLEFTIETANINTGDSLIIYSGAFTTSPVYLAVGNNYTASNITYTMSDATALVVFKSNADASVAAGFSIRFKKRYYANDVLPSSNNIAGNSLVFYGQKGALRSGLIVPGAAVGENSSAFGNSTQATGFNATAFGLTTEARSANTVAMGNGSIARAGNAVAMGTYSEAAGVASVAAGTFSLSSGESAIAMGNSCNASGDASVALGNDVFARGSYSFATGSRSLANAALSFATGFLTEARGYNSTTFGYLSRAEGSYSVAMGLNSVSRSYGCLTIGRYNDTISTESTTSFQAGDRAFVIGDGTGDATRSASFYILKNGNGWMQGTLTQNSDARLKTNIHRVDNALRKIKSLTGYRYNWKDSSAMPGIYTGVLAQEVQKVMPELVVPNTEGQLAVNYNGMVPYLIESIKTLEQRIRQLEAENKRIKKGLKK